MSQIFLFLIIKHLSQGIWINNELEFKLLYYTLRNIKWNKEGLYLSFPKSIYNIVLWQYFNKIHPKWFLPLKTLKTSEIRENSRCISLRTKSSSTYHKNSLRSSILPPVITGFWQQKNLMLTLSKHIIFIM